VISVVFFSNKEEVVVLGVDSDKSEVGNVHIPTCGSDVVNIGFSLAVGDLGLRRGLKVGRCQETPNVPELA